MVSESPPPRAAEVPVQSAEDAEPDLDGVFSSDGVDLTVIRWMLERTPEERLDAVQQLIDATWSPSGREA